MDPRTFLGTVTSGGVLVSGADTDQVPVEVGMALDVADVAELVKYFETGGRYSFSMSARREGSLIQAPVGSSGGVGRRP